MIISVYGAGYVGLVSAACLARLGHEVYCVDIDAQKIAGLTRGECPIFEKDLPELIVQEQERRRLHFTTDVQYAIHQADVHVIATGTPSDQDGKADLSQVFAAAKRIAAEAQRDTFIVTKSTVPVGTGDALQQEVDKELAAQNKSIHIELTSNPEFLREGTAVFDFLQADRIIIGGSEQGLAPLRAMYQPLVEKGVPLLSMSRRSAELTKYSANAMLATRISFMNQISQLAEHFGADIDQIKQGMALDPRIGPLFLNAGIGYGGSCFPKDVSALIHTAREVDLDASLLQAVEDINHQQKNWMFQRVSHHFNQQLSGLTLGVWGLSFKPGTDDLREASSLVAIDQLLAAGVKIVAFDPVAMTAVSERYNHDSGFSFCDSAEAIFKQRLDGLLIMTEWPEFKNYSLASLKQALNNAPLFDGRNCYSLASVAAAQISAYYSVGRPVVVS